MKVNGLIGMISVSLSLELRVKVVYVIITGWREGSPPDHSSLRLADIVGIMVFGRSCLLRFALTSRSTT